MTGASETSPSLTNLAKMWRQRMWKEPLGVCISAYVGGGAHAAAWKKAGRH